MSQRPQTADLPVTSRGSELRHIEVAETPNDGRFVRTALIAWTLICAILIALSVVADPLAEHGTGWFEPLVPNDRDVKAAAYNQLPSPPTALVLGSSRSMMIAPACLAHAVGGPAFNFGLNSARAEDYEAAFKFASARGAVSQVLLGIDPEALHEIVPTDSRLLNSRALRTYLAPELRLTMADRAFQTVESALSVEGVSGSVRVLKLAIGGHPEAAYTFAPDGLIQRPMEERLMREGRYDLPAAIAASIKEYTSRYAGFSKLSESRRKRLEAFLKQARASHTEVVAFIPPLHPQLQAALDKTSLPARVTDTVELLSELEQRGLLRFARVERLDQFGGDPKAFTDGAHMTSANGNKLIAAIYRTEPCALQ